MNTLFIEENDIKHWDNNMKSVNYALNVAFDTQNFKKSEIPICKSALAPFENDLAPTALQNTFFKNAQLRKSYQFLDNQAHTLPT